MQKKIEKHDACNNFWLNAVDAETTDFLLIKL
jgi:hypothetical protein